MQAIDDRTVMMPVPLVTFAGLNDRDGVVGGSYFLKRMSSIARISHGDRATPPVRV